MVLTKRQHQVLIIALAVVQFFLISLYVVPALGLWHNNEKVLSFSIQFIIPFLLLWLSLIIYTLVSNMVDTENFENVKTHDLDSGVSHEEFESLIKIKIKATENENLKRMVCVSGVCCAAIASVIMKRKESCCVCLEEIKFDVGDELLMLRRCRHLFHRECLWGWARKNNCCPLCRFEIVSRKTS